MADRLPPTDRTFTVLVRPKHFEGAVRGDNQHCLLVQAIRQTFPDIEDADVVDVDGTDMTVRYYDKSRSEWPLDKTALWRHDGSRLIRRFDKFFLGPDDIPDGATVTFVPVGTTFRG